MDLINWIDTLRPFSDLPCVSCSYLKADWEHPLFKAQADALKDFGELMPTMRYWEHVRSVIFMGAVKGLKVLDIGTRESLLPHYFASKGAKVTACDLQPESIVDDGSVEVRQEDAVHLSFKSETFDRITCTAAVKHMPKTRDMLAVLEMARVLKPGGLLAITVDYAEKFADYPNPATGSRSYDKKALYRRLIRPSGLEIVGPVDYDRSDWDDWEIRHQSPTAFQAGKNIQVAFVLLQKPR